MGGNNRRKGRSGGKGKGKGRQARGPVGGGARGGGPIIKRTPNFLMYLNQYNAYRVVSYLDQEERHFLGRVYPRFRTKRPESLKQKEEEAAKKNQIEAKKNAREKKLAALQEHKEEEGSTEGSEEAGQRTEEEKIDDEMEFEDEESCKLAFHLPSDLLDEKEDIVEDIPNIDVEDTEDIPNLEVEPAEVEAEVEPPKEEKTEDTKIEEKPEEPKVEEKLEEPKAEEKTEETKTAEKEEEEKSEEKKEEEKKEETEEEKKAREKREKDDITKTNPSVSDPHTLLARLNSRRLYQRIKSLRKENKDFDVKTAYTLNKTTEQIASFEWNVLLKKYKEDNVKRIAQEKRRNELRQAGKEVDDEEDVQITNAFPFPSSCELLLFSPCPRAVAVLASYPRSGNSLLRNLYERTTLRVTGSDMRGGLTKHDLVGEAATQTNSVQFVKTHFPERLGAPKFKVDRAVLLVRNPYDAMDSFFNLMTTNTHTTSLSDEQREKAKDAFADMARKEILVWRDFHEYWLRQNIPLLVIRYEDLIRYTDKVIALVLQFVLEINDMRFFEKRIDRAVREEQIEKIGAYRPRSGGIGKSISKYPPELLQHMNMGIVNTMEKFGYKEMLVPTPSEWKLEPLDHYGVYIPGTAKEPLEINDIQPVKMVRTGRQTKWREVRAKMNGEEVKPGGCTCYKCIKLRSAQRTKEEEQQKEGEQSDVVEDIPVLDLN